MAAKSPEVKVDIEGVDPTNHPSLNRRTDKEAAGGGEKIHRDPEETEGGSHSHPLGLGQAEDQGGERAGQRQGEPPHRLGLGPGGDLGVGQAETLSHCRHGSGQEAGSPGKSLPAEGGGREEG